MKQIILYNWLTQTNYVSHELGFTHYACFTVCSVLFTSVCWSICKWVH